MRTPREATKSEGSGSSRTPLQDLYGTITPSSLHFERHHSGVPSLDPQTHELVIHGLVERPLVFSIEALRRFPSVSQVNFIECAGNGSGVQQGNPASDVQKSHGLLSCSEWTGVPLKLLLEETGLKPEAKWMSEPIAKTGGTKSAA